VSSSCSLSVSVGVAPVAWFLRELFGPGRAKAREWLARKLPVILANRAEGVSVSTFEPQCGRRAPRG
jgi:hypothetical protein